MGAWIVGGKSEQNRVCLMPENKIAHKKETKTRRNHFVCPGVASVSKCIRKCSLHRALDAGSTWPRTL